MRENKLERRYILPAEDRKVYEEAYQKQSAAYDKAVLSLSGGALGLSITFIRQIVHGTPSGILLLELAWGGFALSILAIFVSMLTSQWALQKAVCQTDEDNTKPQRIGHGALPSQPASTLWHASRSCWESDY
jgi:hypothetical protein